MAKGVPTSLLQIFQKNDVGIVPVLASSRSWHEPVLPLLASTFLRITYQFPPWVVLTIITMGDGDFGHSQKIIFRKIIEKNSDDLAVSQIAAVYALFL